MDPIILDIEAQSIVEIETDVSDATILDLYEANAVVITPDENTYINRRIYIQHTEPTNPLKGSLWIEID